MRFPIEKWRQSRRLVLVTVSVALILDTVLTTVIVPMLPDFLKRMQDLEAVSSDDVALQNSSSTPSGNGSSASLTTKIGVLIASKTLFEMASSPVFGKMGDRFGYTVIMLVGFFVTFSSTLMFAFTDGYYVMLIARSIQGLGSAAMFSPGMGLLACVFPDKQERAQAISVAYGGAIFGLIIGPTYGGIMYQLYGKTVPFIVLAVITLIDGCLRSFIAEPERMQQTEKGASLKELLTDPYIVITLGGMFFVSFNFAIMEPLLPVWMMETMDANSAEQGLAFLPVFLTLLLALSTLNRLTLRFQARWLAMIGFLLLGVCMILLPLPKTQIQLIIPTAFIGIGTGLVDCSLLPSLGYLVDLRHKSVYGTVYALSQSAYCLAVVVGAPLGGLLAASIGFEWTMCIAGIACFLYTPFLYCIRTPAKEEEQPLVGSF